MTNIFNMSISDRLTKILTLKKIITIKSPLNIYNNFTSHSNDAGIENSIERIKSPLSNSSKFFIYVSCSTKKHSSAPHKFTFVHQKSFFRKTSLHWKVFFRSTFIPFVRFKISNQLKIAFDEQLKKVSIGWRASSYMFKCSVFIHVSHLLLLLSNLFLRKWNLKENIQIIAKTSLRHNYNSKI